VYPHCRCTPRPVYPHCRCTPRPVYPTAGVPPGRSIRLPVKPHAGQSACRSTPRPVNPQLTYYYRPIASSRLPYCITSSEQLVLVREPAASIGVLRTHTHLNCSRHMLACEQISIFFDSRLLYHRPTLCGGSFKIDSWVPLAPQ